LGAAVIRKSRRSFFTNGTAALVLLGLAAPRLSQSDPSNTDIRLFRRVNNAQSSSKTSLFGVTDSSVFPIVVAAPVLFTIYGLAADRNEEFESGVLSGASEVLSYGALYLLKVGF
jgi:hypothetical protein